jgi:hydroxyacylglutathione hydrolase
MQIADNLHAFIWESTTENNCNSYLIDGPTRVLIDPGHVRLFNHVQKGLRELKLEISDIDLIICTHMHPDHIEAVQLFKNSNALIALHEKEWRMIRTMNRNLRASMGLNYESIVPDILLKEGDLSVHDIKLTVLETPGHSPGSVSIYWKEKKALFTSDLIFKEGVGRTDVPGGNGDLLKESIKRMGALDMEWLLPGHGEPVSGGGNIQKNFEQVEQFYFQYV